MAEAIQNIMSTQTDTNPYNDVIPYQAVKNPANPQSGQSNKPASPQNTADQFM
jgi:hypothetical protein